MTRFRKWNDFLDELLTDPEAQASYDRARAELDKAWEVVCPYRYCVWWVSPDSNVREELGGVGPVDCPCKANE